MPRMTTAWHKDASGHSDPERFVGKQYFHPKTGHLYRVVGYGIDAQRELWVLSYVRVAGDVDEVWAYHHTIEDFTRDGRFLEVQ